jgi:hypothetical protein
MGGFDQGFALGGHLAERNTDRKWMLADEERRSKAGQYIETGKSQIADLRELEKNGLKDSQQYKDLQQAHGNTQYAFNQLYHPDNAPGAIQKDWHYLFEKMHGIVSPQSKTPSSSTSQAPATTLNTPAAPLTTPDLPAIDPVKGVRVPSLEGSAPVAGTTGPGMANPPKGATPTMAVAKPQGLMEAGTIPIWNRQSVLHDNGTHSRELAISIPEGQGNEVLIPLIVDGKFLTPNGKMPAGDIPQNADEWDKASPEWKALKMRAEAHYKKTGQHLGKFGGGTPEENKKNVDAYAQVLDSRGAGTGATPVTLPAPPPVTVTKAPPVPWGQAQLLKKQAASMQKAQEQAALLASGVGLSPEQQAEITAHAGSAGRYANLQGDMAAWDKDNPNAPKDDRNAQYNQLYQKWFGTTGKGNWKPATGTVTDPTDPNKKIHVSYNFNSSTNQYANTDGSPVRPDLLATFTPDASAAGGNEQDYQDAAAKGYEGSRAQFRAEQAARGRGSIAGLKYDKATGQISDPATGKRYNANDEYNPPEVSEMFKQQASFLKKQQDFQLKMAGVRGAAYNMTKPMIVLDTANDNSPSVATFGDMQKQPGRYVPAGEADKAIVKENLMQDIAGSSKATRKAISDLKEDFPADMQVKMAIAMKSEDPPDSLNQLFPAAAINSLSDDQQKVFIAVQQLVEQGMAMRSVLGAGQGSDTMRAAMRTTLPSVLGPSKSFAMKQLDAFDATVARLHRGVPKVKLNETPMADLNPSAQKHQLNEIKKFTSGPQAGKTGIWNGTGWAIQ